MTLTARAFLLFLFPGLNAVAQAPRQPALLITQDSVEIRFNRRNIHVLEDPGADYTISELSNSPASSKFHLLQASPDHRVRYWWFRMTLKNTLSHDVHLLIPANGSETDFYFSENGGHLRHFRSGEAVPWRHKDGLKRLNQVPVTVAAGHSLVIYKREYYGLLYAAGGVSTSIGVENAVVPELADGGPFNTTWLVSAVAGMIGLAMAAGFFLFVATGNRTYLWYALFLFFEGLTFTEFLDDTLFREFPGGVRVAGTVASFAMVFFQVRLLTDLFRVKDRFPKWNTLLEWAAALVVAAGFAGLAFAWFRWSDAGLRITQLLGYLAVFGLLITLCLVTRSKDRQERWIAWGAIPVFAWWGVGYFYAYVCTQLGTTGNFLFLLFARWQDGLEILVMSWFTLLFLVALVLRHQAANGPHLSPARDSTPSFPQ